MALASRMIFRTNKIYLMCAFISHIYIMHFLFLVQYFVPENSVGFQIDLTSFHLEKNLFKHTVTLYQRPKKNDRKR